MAFDKLRFLVVEDHDFQRHAVVGLLNGLGAAAVYEAHDGSSALRVIRDPDRPVDVVISDLSMPGMDGVEFIRHLSATDRNLALILFSALDAPLLASVANMAQAYRVDLLGAISKPATAAKLAPMIELYDARRSRSAAPVVQEPEFSHGEIAEAWQREAFETCLAPRVDLRTGALVAAQASMLWRHPTRGVLAPAVYMPALHAQGLSDDLVWLMLRRAAAQCAALRQHGLQVSVAVHLALASMTDIHLAGRIQQTAANQGLAPQHMVLGIAEPSVETDLGEALESLVRLRMAGFGLAIADFGTGRMSKDLLERIAFTELVIHRTLVTGAWRDGAARAGLATGLELARDMGLVAVADGVKTREDWEFVRQWGCDAAQGDYIAPPMPLHAFIDWAAAWELRRSR
ncbi:MAG: EAL domain-containing response regulator [Burkholderiales bacterium]|nr:EAL domain-containing response regulator [Burkholderiales bacterium]